MNAVKVFKIIAGCAVGFVSGYGIMALSQSWNFATAMIVTAATLLVVSAISAYVHIVLHEAGHLIAGLLTGYKFSFFRIHKWAWAKIDGRIQLRQYPLVAAPGQCIMDPSAFTKDNIPFEFYNRGGYLMNFLLAALALIAMFLLPKDTGIEQVVRLSLLIFSLVGLFLGITNAWPMNMAGLDNDGSNIEAMQQDPHVVHAFYKTLMISHSIQQGVPMESLPEEIVSVGDDWDLSTAIPASIAVHYVMWLRENGRMDDANALEARLDKSKFNFGTASLELDQRKKALLEPEIHPEDHKKRSADFKQFLSITEELPDTLSYRAAYALRVLKKSEKAEEYRQKLLKMTDYLFTEEWKKEVDYLEKIWTLENN